MKRKILPLILLSFMIIKAYPQNFVGKVIRGERGISKQLVNLDGNQPIAFNATQIKSLVDLNQSSDLILKKTESDKLGFVHYRYYQTYKNVPVENTMYIVHTKNGLLKSLGGNIVLDFDSRMNERITQKISGSQAAAIAIKYVGATLYAWQDAGMEKSLKEQMKDPKATYLPNTSLVWYNPGNIVSPRELRLCYKVDVYAKQPLSRAYYYVDASTGTVLGKKNEIFFSDTTGTANTYYSGAQTIHSNHGASNYQLRDLTKGGGIITVHGEIATRGNNYTSSSPNWTLSGENIAALDAHYGVSQTYAFYQTNFGRDSYDNAGTALYSYVNDPTYEDNAFWDGTSMNFNKRSDAIGGGVTGIDVTGHELTHGITQETSGLDYSFESGAMNESMSDIMGKSVQFWSKPTDIDWQLSNDMDWIIRDMSNPNAVHHPDTYKGDFWYTGGGDNGGVHENSGVGNFMFYLLVEGGSGTNDNGDSYSVTGIDLAKADQILYRSNITYLTPNSQYIDWRAACISSATDLYGATSTEVMQVQNAFHAVGIGSAAGVCDPPTGIILSDITTKSATISWDATGGSEKYKLQYKVSTDSVWTTVNNIHANSYILKGLTPSTIYKVRVQTVCGQGHASGFSVMRTFITTIEGGPAYCTTSGTTGYEYIKKVDLGTIHNETGDDFGYGNYSGLFTNLTAGDSYTIKLTPGFNTGTWTEYWTVFIDFNQNGIFTDAGERIAYAHGTDIAKKAIAVPATATPGFTRMRIVMHYNSNRTNPCNNFSDGEAEDYSVNIVGTPLKGIASADAIRAYDVNSILVTPNPLKGSTANLVLQVNKTAPVNIKITDLSGRVLRSETINGIQAGKNNHTLNDLNLKPGTYIIIAQQGNAIIARTQVIVAK
jgi:Zn-dependent metalloprotease